uniref:Transmembrane protein n=1 Tax=Parastrongyloides trichosuri TaxID=131310 RepID=A0A0N4ZRR2_PARTI
MVEKSDKDVKNTTKVLHHYTSVCQPETNEVRKNSTETLNRLNLVSQILEQEVEHRYWSEMYGDRILFIIRFGSMILMAHIICLIIIGKGTISYNNEKETTFIWLSIEKWLLPNHNYLPETFNNIKIIRWQFFCTICVVGILLLQMFYTYLHISKIEHSLCTCKLILSICCFILFSLFFIEGFFSFCPWIETNIKNGDIVNELPASDFLEMETCSIGSWFLAAQLLLATCLLMCFEFFVILNIGSTDVHINDRRRVNLQSRTTSV